MSSLSDAACSVPIVKCTQHARKLQAQIVLVRLHGVAPLENDRRKETYDFFPAHVLREAAVAVVLLLALVVYTMASPPGVGEPANPAVTPAGKKDSTTPAGRGRGPASGEVSN